MSHLREHIQRVEAWADAKGLYNTDSPMVQFGKAVEELGELIMSIGKNDVDGIKDAIGDVRVCLINVCRIAGVEFTCNEHDDVPDWQLREILDCFGVIAKSMASDNKIGVQCGVQYTNDNLFFVAGHYGLTLEECDNHAWDQIKNRTGKTVGGEFVKDSK